jgi:hypothetical protein
MLAFRVIVMVGGYSETHTDLLGYEEAEALAKELTEDFPDMVYYVESYEYEEKQERVYNENACDGWEDIYPLDEY